MSTLSQFALACNSIVLKEVLAVMFENDNENDFNLVIDMHTKLNDLGMRIRQRAELILDVEKQGYSAEVFESVKLLKDLQETDNAKARSFMKVINETELKILEKISLIVQFQGSCLGIRVLANGWIFHYILQKQVFMDDAHYDMPLVYNVEGLFLHFGRPEFSLIIGLHFGSYSFRKFKSGDVPFVSTVLPHTLDLKVSNLDLLGLIKDEELFGKLDDDDVVRVCLLLALEVIFIGKKLVDEVPDTLMRLVENLVVWNDFRWGEYIWRHLYDQIMNIVNKKKWEHLQGLSKARNSVPTYTLFGFVWSFNIWILESFQGSLFWWNRDPKIIPRGLAWSRKQLFKRSYYSLLFGKVNLDLTPTISEQQTVWYMAFRKFYMSYIPRTPPTTYTDLFDDYIKKLSASHKRGKIDTRDLLIIRRCDTTSVEEIRLKDDVIAKLNSRVFKLEAIIKVLGREQKGVSLGPAMIDLDSDDHLVKDYLIQEESRLKQEEEERCRLEEHKMMEALFLKTLQQEISNGKITQRSSAFSAYYWGNTFAMAEKDRPLNSLNDQDMNLFLKDVTPWVEDLSRYNQATDRVHLTDAFDIFLGRQGPLRCRFPWCKDVSVDRRFWESLVCLDPTKKGWIMDEHVELWVNYMWHVRPHDADWAMVGGYFVQLLLQDSIPSWYADDTFYKVSWCDVKEIIAIPEPLLVWLVAPFCISQLGNNLVLSANYHVGDSRLLCAWVLEVDGYSITSYRMIVSVPTPFSARLLGFNSDEQPIIEVDDIGYQMDTTLQVYHRTHEEFQNLGVESNFGSFFVGAFRESLSHGLSLDVDNPIQTALAYREHLANFFKHSVAMWTRISSSSGPSTPPSLYTRPSKRPSYSARIFESALNLGKAESSNCKFLAEKIKTLEANIKILEGTLEMERHPENHTLESAKILHELYNDMGKLGLE
ncbi:hypothetical protein Tco_1556413 [Tanacetum coccineum]